MEAKTIQKYKKYSVPKLIEIATRHCNKYIRLRDDGKPCVSCDSYSVLEAGHFYSGGHYSSLRFHENNIHGQCKRCNSHLHGNLNEYRKNITNRISIGDLSELDFNVSMYKRTLFKWDRFDLIEIIEKYKQKIKEL